MGRYLHCMWWSQGPACYSGTHLPQTLFSADGFGKFGALDMEDDWADEARRYYIGIVGKLLLDSLLYAAFR